LPTFGGLPARPTKSKRLANRGDDQLQLQKAITTRAIPVLEFLAEHPNYLEQTLNRRFDRDGAPNYESWYGFELIGVLFSSRASLKRRTY
jgi:hypothetical protein